MQRLLPCLLVAFGLYASPPSAELVATLHRASVDSSWSVAPLVVHRGGYYFVVGTYVAPAFPFAGIDLRRIGPAGKNDLYILKLSGQTGRVVSAVTIGGSEDETVRQVAVDDAGDVIIAGYTTSADLPTTTGAYRMQGRFGSFVLKWNAATTGLTYCTYLDEQYDIVALALDSDGAAYVGGSVSMGQPPLLRDGLVAKLNPSGSQLDFVKTLGGMGDRDTVLALVMSSSGTLVMSGRTNSPDFPTTPGAYLPSVAPLPGDSYIAETGFLASIDRDGTTVLFSTYTGQPPDQWIQVDNAENIYTGGSEFRQSYRKYSPGAVRLVAEHTVEGVSGGPLFVDPDGTAYLFGQSGSGFPTLNSLQPCAANAADGPSEAGNNTVVTIFDPGGEVRMASFLNLPQGPPVSRGPWRRFYSIEWDPLYEDQNIFQWPLETSPTRLTAACLVHTATFESVYASPGALMSVLGSGLGPLQSQMFLLEDGRVPTQLAGVQVTVNGVPAPVLYVQDRQVNFVVPWALSTAAQDVTVCVIFQGERSCLKTRSAVARPGAFRLPDGKPIVLNQDDTLNAPDHPAPRESVITLYLTGTGALSPPIFDGGVNRAPFGQLELPVHAQLLFLPEPCTPICVDPPPPVPAEVTYAGATPGLVAGVTQVNVRLPGNAPSGTDIALTLCFDASAPATSTSVSIR